MLYVIKALNSVTGNKIRKPKYYKVRNDCAYFLEEIEKNPSVMQQKETQRNKHCKIMLI